MFLSDPSGESLVGIGSCDSLKVLQRDDKITFKDGRDRFAVSGVKPPN